MKKLAFILLLLLTSITIKSQDRQLGETDSINTTFACPVQTDPQFQGGTTEMMRFISENLMWPQVHSESCIEGRVVVKFLVTETGELSDIKIVRSLEKHFDEEAIRVVKLMPRWIPAQMNGKNVPCYYTLPVLFRLSR